MKKKMKVAIQEFRLLVSQCSIIESARSSALRSSALRSSTEHRRFSFLNEFFLYSTSPRNRNCFFFSGGPAPIFSFVRQACGRVSSYFIRGIGVTCCITVPQFLHRSKQIPNSSVYGCLVRSGFVSSSGEGCGLKEIGFFGHPPAGPQHFESVDDEQ